MGAERREIEIRTWPETVDVLVVDVERAILLAHYEMDAERGDNPLFSPFASHDQRAGEAIRALQADPEFLRAHFHTGEADVELVETAQPRESVRSLLREHGLELDAISLRDLPRLAAELGERDHAEIYRLMVDWYDVVELHYPQGYSYGKEDSWVHRATPGNCFNFHYQAAGIESLSESNEEIEEDAYELFLRLIDRPLSEYSFGFFLRWVYYHLAEFPQADAPTPLAWQEAGIS